MLGFSKIMYVQQQPAGAIPPPESLQLAQSVPEYFYQVQITGPGAVATSHVDNWFTGPGKQSGYNPQSKQAPIYFRSGPPLDPRMYDLPAATSYGGPGMPGGDCQ